MYIMITIRGFNHSLWFKKAEFSDSGGVVKGSNGWGERGAFIAEFECPSSEVLTRMSTDRLQYT